jgi:ribosomal protein S18 acetylase RimI-like enzyme
LTDEAAEDIEMSAARTRPAEERDLPAVAALFDAYRQFYEMPADLALARRYLGERFERGESVILVAEDARGEIIGFTQLYPAFCSVLADRTYVLYDLFVTPAARGTGAGRALMEAAEAYARAHGAARLQLQTAVTNRVGQSLYESCGWKRPRRSRRSSASSGASRRPDRRNSWPHPSGSPSSTTTGRSGPSSRSTTRSRSSSTA